MREEIELVQLEGAELYVEDVGPIDAPALLVVHGGPGASSYVLRESMGEWLEDYRVLYLDQRGGGRSPELPPEPALFTVDALVEDFEDLRLHFGLERFSLLSHGFGAIPALEYARRYSQNVQGALLVSPWICMPKLAQRLFRASMHLQGVGEVPAPEDPGQALAEAFAQAEAKKVFDALMFPSEHVRMELEWMSEGELIGGNAAEMFVYNGLWKLDYTPFLIDFPGIPQVVVGRQDGTSYPEQAETLADLVGGGLHDIEGAGHYPWLDQPQAFATLLYDWLDALED